MLLTTAWLLDQTEVTERSEARVQAPWSGLWYVNVGEDSNCSWYGMRRLGFISAGGGDLYSERMQRLQVGDPIAAFQKQAWHVGYGKVTSTAVMAKDFDTVQGPLLQQQLIQPSLAHDRDDLKRAEYVVGVDWIRTVPIGEAEWAEGPFANQDFVYELRDPKTVDFLREQFGAAAE
jgi:hypothetical protein